VKEDVNGSNVKVTTCRNSVQGKVLIVDDRGKYIPPKEAHQGKKKKKKKAVQYSTETLHITKAKSKLDQ
jgi:hypothetical protein